ncbi:hypothetical protein D7M10_11525 [Pseudomonas fluorescens]|nr:hypothetical protein D7M10_11525 [Pseudomonas fluorescens]
MFHSEAVNSAKVTRMYRPRRSKMWERACSRKQWVSQHQCLLGRRLREQARSHTSVGQERKPPSTFSETPVV